VSSSRERNDRSKPSNKPFSKAPKGGPREGAKTAGKGPVQARPAQRESARPAYDPAASERTSERPGRPGPRHRRQEASNDWLWGWHAVQAALANPNREGFKRLLVSPARAHEIASAAAKAKVRFEQMEGPDIARHLPPGAVHQGIALLADPLDGDGLEPFLMQPGGVLLMLDQLTDPQNVGAIFRSAAAFGARGVILQDRHAPALAGALAKAAAGAVDALPHARVINLSRALEQLAEAGWRGVGLDGQADLTLEQAIDERPTVLVLGSEGDGLRRLVAEHCEVLAKIPMPGGFESLNVSNAAAVALYEAARKQR
jgi:23S rRNA (guanosine2251-2'-O)-methyltransferase